MRELFCRFVCNTLMLMVSFIITWTPVFAQQQSISQSQENAVDLRPRYVGDHNDDPVSQTVLVGSRVWLQPAAVQIDMYSLDDQFDRTTGKCRIADCRFGEIDLNEYTWASNEDVDAMLRAFGLRGFRGNYRICAGCTAHEPPNSMDVIFNRFTFTSQYWAGDFLNALTRDGDPPDRCGDEVTMLPDGTEISTGCSGGIPGQTGIAIRLHRATGAGLDTQAQRNRWNNTSDFSEVLRSHWNGAWLYKDSLRVQEPPSGPLCENSSIATCATHNAKCIVVRGTDGLITDVCKWQTKNSIDKCESTAGIWTTPDSKYASRHPGVVAPGSTGTCISEVKNIRKL